MLFTWADEANSFDRMADRIVGLTTKMNKNSMLTKGFLKFYFLLVLLGVIMFTPFVSGGGLAVYGQMGNSISGVIFGLNRQPLADINVELMDEFSRTLQRSRTGGSGRYFFGQLASGRFKVRVLPYATDYEEQDQDVEIVNFSRPTSGGGTTQSGFSNEVCDFYLRLKKGVNPTTNGTVFAQDIPAEAKKLYEKAIVDLDNKKEKEAFEELKSALEIFPKYFLALERLGTEYVRKQYFEAASILLNVAVDVYPRAYTSWYGLAYSLYSLKNYPAALTAVQKAIELNSSAPEPLLLSGSLMRQSGRYGEAEKQLIKARELSKDTLPFVHWELALLYGNDLKRYGDAAKELKAFLKAQPDTKDADKITKKIAEFEAKANEK